MKYNLMYNFACVLIIVVYAQNILAWQEAE